MKKITTLGELEELKEIIQKADEAKDQSNRGAGRLEFASSRVKRWNKIYQEHGIYDPIEVTPELASFLVNDERAHKNRTEGNDSKGFRNTLGLIKDTWMTMVWPDPAHLAYRAGKIASRVIEAKELAKEYERLLAQRNNIAEKVMGCYLLKQDKEERYILERNQWGYAQASVSEITINPPVGIDEKLDISRLPQLPKPPEVGVA